MQKEERVKITPSYPACSTEKENCMGSGCCKTSGHTCYKKNQHLALCNETCSTGKGRDAARRQGTPATKRISIWHCATRHAPLERVGSVRPPFLTLCPCRRFWTLPCTASLCTHTRQEARSRAMSSSCCSCRRSMVLASSNVEAGMSSAIPRSRLVMATTLNR